MKFYFSILFLGLMTTTSIAQNHLIPETGPSGELDEYDIALHRVFAKGYADDVELRMLVLPSFGIEFMAGLKSTSAGYRLFSLTPDSSIWYSSWKTVLCSQPHDSKSISRKDGSKTCKIRDFSEVSSDNTTLKSISIDSTKAKMLQSVWQEMVMNSKYHASNSVIVDGVKYLFSAFVYSHGIIGGYTHSPADSTQPAKLTDIGTDIFYAIETDSIDKQNKIIDSVYTKSQNLMKEILGSGTKYPKRELEERFLSACTAPQNSFFKSEYCWQSQLDDDEYPEFIIANRTEGRYRYELKDFTSKRKFRSISILPAVYTNSMFREKEVHHSLKPWDIYDIVTGSYNNQILIFGVDDSVISNKEIRSKLNLTPNTLLVLFDGINNDDYYGDDLEIDGDFDRLTLKKIFKEQ